MASWTFLCLMLLIVYSKLFLAASNVDSDSPDPVSSKQQIQQGITQPVRSPGCPQRCSCKMDDNHHIVSVDCSSSGLLKGIPDLPYTTTELSLWNNSISNITCDSFKHLHSLHDLNIGHNNISYLPPCVFQSQTSSLLSLNVSENYVTYLDVKLLQNLFHLQILNFSFNLIELLAPRTFSDLGRLVNLNLSFNLIKEIAPDAFRGLHSLKILSLENNFLDNDTSFHKNVFQDLGALETLNTKANLGILGDAISPLRNLTILYMDIKSNYTMLGTGFRQLVNLQHLHLSTVVYGLPPQERKFQSTCSMPTVSSNFFTNIRTEKALNLHMRNCSIQTIGNSSFQPLSTLDYLDLAGNVHLNWGINGQGWMKSLINTSITDLDLSVAWVDNATFHMVPMWFFQTIRQTKLKSLKLAGNFITMVYPGKLWPETIEYLDFRANAVYLFNLYYFFLYSNSGDYNLKKLDASVQVFSYTGRPKRNSDNTVDEIKVEDFTSSDTYSKTPAEIGNVSVLSEKPDRMLMNGPQFLNISMGETTAPSPADVANTVSPTVFHSTTKSPADLKVLDSNITDIYLPAHLETLIAMNSMVGFWTVVPHIRVLNNTVLRQVDLSLNSLTHWLGPVENVPSLTFLDLQSNQCEDLTVYFFKDMVSLETLLLRNNILGVPLGNDVNGLTFSTLTNLRVLDLSENGIRNLSRQAFIHNTKLERLYLYTNRLNTIQPTFSAISNMSYLNLSDNLLPGLEERNCEELKLLKSRNKNFKVNLRDNQLLFTCEYISFLELVFSTPHIFDEIELMEFKHLNETKLDYKKFVNQFPSLARACQVQRFFYILLIAFFIVVGTVAISALVYHKRWKLQYLYRIGRRRLHIGEQELEYRPMADVFMTYDQDDPNWRRFMQRIFLPGLNQRNITHLVGEVDFPGGDLRAHVAGAIVGTRKTVVLLSQDIFDERDRVFEMNLCIMREMDTQSQIIVPIFVEEVELAAYPREIELFLRNQWERCLTYGDTDDFWDAFVNAVREDN